MKLSEIKGEEALDVIADLLDPIAELGKKEKIKKADRKDRKAFIQVILKEGKKEIIQILAILDRTPVEKYEVTLATLPGKVLELFSDPTIMELFGFQSQEEQPKSGSATENTEGEKK